MARTRELAEHELMREVMASLKPFLERSYRSGLRNLRARGTMHPKKPRPIKPASDMYNYAVFYRLTKVLESFDLLAHAEIMVRRQPNGRLLTKWGFTADHWLAYHYNSFLVAVVGIEDRCLLLVNDVLRMGLHHTDCKAAVFRNHGLIGRRVRNALAAVAKAVAPHREQRNSAVHRGDNPHLDEVMGWDEYDWLTGRALVSRTGNPMKISQAALDRDFWYSGQLLASKLRQVTTKARSATWRLFEALRLPYRAWLSHLGGGRPTNRRLSRPQE